MSAMEEALQSASKFYSNKWVVDKVPNTVIENNELYYKFTVVVQIDLTNLQEYFNQHIIDEVSRPFSHHHHVEKS